MNLKKFSAVAAALATVTLAAVTVTDETPRRAPQPGVFRIMFTGNSITMHGFNDWTIKNLGWDRQCGMAASKLEQDYVHLFAALVASARNGERIEITSPDISRTAMGMPFVQIGFYLSLTDRSAVDDLYIYYKTASDDSWSEDKKAAFSTFWAKMASHSSA